MLSTFSASNPVRKSGQTEGKGYSGIFTSEDVHHNEDAHRRDSALSGQLRPSPISLAQLMPPQGGNTAWFPFQPTKPGEQRMLPGTSKDGVAVRVDREMGEGEGEDLYRPAVGGVPGYQQVRERHGECCLKLLCPGARPGRPARLPHFPSQALNPRWSPVRVPREGSRRQPRPTLISGQRSSARHQFTAARSRLASSKW